jgi:hypothetical protein
MNMTAAPRNKEIKREKQTKTKTKQSPQSDAKRKRIKGNMEEAKDERKEERKNKQEEEIGGEGGITAKMQPRLRVRRHQGEVE